MDMMDVLDTDFCLFHKNDLMTVIRKNDKHLVTFYNIIFQIWQASCHIWVISSINTRGQQCATEMKCIWETFLSDQTNTQTVISLKT